MWNKPSEITANEPNWSAIYNSNGYEISHSTSGTVNAAGALAGWKGSTGHNNVILNLDIWASSTWNAIGAHFADGYAHVWFGKIVDPVGA